MLVDKLAQRGGAVIAVSDAVSGGESTDGLRVERK